MYVNLLLPSSFIALLFGKIEVLCYPIKAFRAADTFYFLRSEIKVQSNFEILYIS